MQPHPEVWGGVRFQHSNFGAVVWSVRVTLTFVTLAAEFVSGVSIATIGFLKGRYPQQMEGNQMI